MYLFRFCVLSFLIGFMSYAFCFKFIFINETDKRTERKNFASNFISKRNGNCFFPHANLSMVFFSLSIYFNEVTRKALDRGPFDFSIVNIMGILLVWFFIERNFFLIKLSFWCYSQILKTFRRPIWIKSRHVSCVFVYVYLCRFIVFFRRIDSATDAEVLEIE